MGVIRLLLALAVVVGHAKGLEGLRNSEGVSVVLVDGRVAVRMFYLISGFYMALILDRVYSGPGSTLAFWTSRYLRLAPLYVIVSLFTLVFIINTSGYEAYSPWLLVSAVISHLLLIGQDVFVFFGYSPALNDIKFMPQILQGELALNPGYDPGWKLLMIEPGWSIGVEVWFYMLAPFLLQLRTRYIVLVAVASLGLKLLLSSLVGWSGDPWNYRFFPSELVVFLIGSLSYRLYAGRKFILEDKRQALLLLLVIYVCLLFYWFLPGGRREKHWLFFLVLYLSLPTIFHLTKDWKVDRWIGELSYPAYITHMAVIALLPELGALKGYVVIAVTLSISALLLVIVEQPIDRLRHDLAKRMMRSRK